MSHETLVERRRTQLLDALDAALPPDRSVALLDIPHFANVGDNAILLGELAALRRLGRRVIHVPTPEGAYTAARLRRCLSGRPLLLHGGGNLGDLWPWHQRLRERLLTDFRDHHIVQLPQSIAFTDETSIARAREAFSRHPRFTLLVRDEPSRAFAEQRLATAAVLAPDAAFGLGPLRRRRAPARDLLVLARSDHEAKAGRATPLDIATEDWIVPRLGAPERLLETVARQLDRRPGRSEAMGAALGGASMWARRGVSAGHLSHGVDLLSSARVVVTDRLHAHVLSLLLGIPHVVTDSVSGKIRALYEAWTSESDLVTWADSLEHGVSLARDIVAKR